MSNRISVPSAYASDVDDDVDEAVSQQQCAACGVTSPPTRGAPSSLSAHHGWRVVRTTLPEGSFLYQWHCPGCWARRRRERIQPL